MTNLRIKEFVNCSWCHTVRRRDTNEPVAEPLQTRLRKEIETHGMCGQCKSGVQGSYRGKPGERAVSEDIKPPM